MIPVARVAIVGVGLMGGSLARALAARGVHVSAFDHDVEQLNAARREGIVLELLDPSLAGANSADVVVLALPVDAAVALLPRIGASLTAPRLIMDLCSTKRSVVAAAAVAGFGARFVGAHPLTGSHRSGWAASHATLFEDARVFLCPTEQTTVEALALAESFWRALHAGVEVIDATEHDVQMAWRSHLPQVLSSALAVTLHRAGVRRSALGPGGRDMTRLAGGSPALWEGIATDNAEALVNALLAAEARLCDMRLAIADGDVTRTRALFTEGREWFDGDPTTPSRPPAEPASTASSRARAL